MKKNKDQLMDEDSIIKCITTLEFFIKNSDQFIKLPEEHRIALLKTAGLLSRPDREEIKRRQKAAKKKNRLQKTESERKARATTGIRKARTKKIFKAPEQLTIPSEQSSKTKRVLNSPRNCYICKDEFVNLHFFYDSMCPKCAEFNYKKRFQSASLKGRTALITGSRLKIGYQATLMMLRAGARVIATTRFPADSALRYSKEKDF